MNRLVLAAFAVTLFCAGGAVAAQTRSPHVDCMAAEIKAMDANGDGLVSHDEYTKYHEARWAKLPKTRDGQVTIKDLEMSHCGMKNSDKMRNDAMMEHRAN